jgi:hypothetical protein
VVGSATLGRNGTVVMTPQLGHYEGAVYQILTTTTGLTRISHTADSSLDP